MVKLGFTGYTLFFLFLPQNIDCGYPLEPSHRGGSNEYPKSVFRAEIWKISAFIIWFFFFSVFGVKFSIYLNRRVFVMWPFFQVYAIPLSTLKLVHDSVDCTCTQAHLVLRCWHLPGYSFFRKFLVPCANRLWFLIYHWNYQFLSFRPAASYMYSWLITKYRVSSQQFKILITFALSKLFFACFVLSLLFLFYFIYLLLLLWLLLLLLFYFLFFFYQILILVYIYLYT